MDRLRKLWQEEQSYQAINDADRDASGQDTDVSGPTESTPVHENLVDEPEPAKFSKVEYGIFLLLGISMLWAWNMFLAAGPYFQQRFRTDAWILDNFQAAEIAVSTVTNLSIMLVLTRLQSRASYPRRISTSLILLTAVFAVLALSTAVPAGASAYFAVIIIMTCLASMATSLCQNGVFAYVSGFGQPAYTHAIMTGQAVAGVLPPLAQVISVMGLQDHSGVKGGHNDSGDADSGGEAPAVPWTAALAYFLTAVAVSVSTLAAFLYLNARQRKGAIRLPTDDSTSDNDDDVAATALTASGVLDDPDPDHPRKTIPLLVLLRKLRWLAASVFLTFACAMVFPIYTQRILSVSPPGPTQPALLRPASFIPLALLFWNSGDLIGRLLSGVPALSLVFRPRVVCALAVARFGYIGLYHLCNIRGAGAAVPSDLFYLVVVQLTFGLTTGFVGSTCMMGAAQWVAPEERPAAGGFMALCLVFGLAAGSLMSFGIAGT